MTFLLGLSQVKGPSCCKNVGGISSFIFEGLDCSRFGRSDSPIVPTNDHFIIHISGPPSVALNVTHLFASHIWIFDWRLELLESRRHYFDRVVILKGEFGKFVRDDYALVTTAVFRTRLIGLSSGKSLRCLRTSMPAFSEHTNSRSDHGLLQISFVFFKHLNSVIIPATVNYSNTWCFNH